MKKLLLLSLCALAFLAPAQQPAAAPKPPLGLPRDAKYFNGKWYAVVLEKANWAVAQSRCKQHGGQLAVAHDEATAMFIKSLSAKLRLWLGATDEKVEGKWIWVDGQEMTYSMWEPAEPSNDNGKENYLRTSPNGRWADSAKEWDAYTTLPIVGYICEWKGK